MVARRVGEHPGGDRGPGIRHLGGAPERFREYWVHDRFETIYVISGVVEVDLDGEIFRLEPSDSISYDTRKPHRLRAATGERVKLLMIEASPGFTNFRLR